jgi:hypothetical protein
MGGIILGEYLIKLIVISLVETVSEYSSGDFRFLPSSQLQAQNGAEDKSSEHTLPSPPRREILEDSDGVPERFRQGRESLSVIRNVTIRV